jgi:hypothetical protein
VTAAAVRLLIAERRWLEKAYDTAEAELEAHPDNAALLKAQMNRLAEDVAEVAEALEILNCVSARTMRVIRTTIERRVA